MEKGLIFLKLIHYKGQDMCQLFLTMYIINIEKKSVITSHHENGQDKMNNCIFTLTLTIP